MSAFAFSPGGAILAVAGKRQEKYSVALWDVTAGKLLRTLDGGQEKPVHSLAFARNGKMLASASEDRTVRLFDVDSPTAPKK